VLLLIFAPLLYYCYYARTNTATKIVLLEMMIPMILRARTFLSFKLIFLHFSFLLPCGKKEAVQLSQFDSVVAVAVDFEPTNFGHSLEDFLPP
jgi:hypothetical protein